ncbi:DUF1501 domain-containing protein [Engelhardtia mirabilis]|uniref:Sulfatase n=1 Tax=Engelhardtia mirabilis TaxID=2528011 RepID=A0A518BEJ0_9BACT|nr:hypothetical protein Pla133_04270 [Planctomycetes bacterium Pla133]QDU99688.1 hypothetical protein Pla86_04270 [Planctomycetes bacterium Pla86]
MNDRRQFLTGAGVGIGSLLLGRSAFGMFRDEGSAADAALPHFAPRAKRVIWLHMAGSPSQIDLWDPKPRLRELDGQPVPASLIENERFAFIKGTPKLLGSPYEFRQHGQSGQWISELLPHTARIADKLCVVRSMHTTQFNHAPAQVFLTSGHSLIGRPTMGAWLSHGLGPLDPDLPAFVVMTSGKFAPSAGSAAWTNGFLPSEHQGVRLMQAGDPVLFLSNPEGVDRAARRRQLDAIARLNRLASEQHGDPEAAARTAQYELAYRMQARVPAIADLATESQATLDLYGVTPGEPSFAANCLLSARLAEAGVRFQQLFDWGWDSHGTNKGDDIVHSLPEQCRRTDRACAALVTDLERRGLLEDTLVVWGGEFGRTPMNEERGGSKFLGRDHHPHAFTIWMAGGGIRPGTSFGSTDELGYFIEDDPMDVHDLHATLLHLLGIDHERFTYRSQGRDFRLTDVAGRVMGELLA